MEHKSAGYGACPGSASAKEPAKSEGIGTSVVLTIPQVAAILKIPTSRAYALARMSVIPVVRLGPRQLRVSTSALREFISGQGVGTSSARES